MLTHNTSQGNERALVPSLRLGNHGVCSASSQGNNILCKTLFRWARVIFILSHLMMIVLYMQLFLITTLLMLHPLISHTNTYQMKYDTLLIQFKMKSADHSRILTSTSLVLNYFQLLAFRIMSADNLLFIYHSPCSVHTIAHLVNSCPGIMET